MEKLSREDWVKALMHDMGKVEGLEQPDGTRHNARKTCEYFYDLACGFNEHTD